MINAAAAAGNRAQRVALLETGGIECAELARLMDAESLPLDRAAGTEQLFAMCAKAPPDLVAVVVAAKDCQGARICREIRSNPVTREVALLLAAGEPDDDCEQDCLAAGADDFLSVTDESVFLRAKIRALLRRAPAFGAFGTRQIGNGERHVLVVDDSDTYREYVAWALDREGFQVSETDTGEQALNRLKAETFDAVVLDMNLPDMHGPLMCAEFAALQKSRMRRFSLLMLTGGEQQREMAAVLDAGADDVVGKSRDIGIVKARLCTLIRRLLPDAS